MLAATTSPCATQREPLSGSQTAQVTTDVMLLPMQKICPIDEKHQIDATSCKLLVM